eukprot:CAMPEP_0197907756 /NCGR_PEP_ID=MMETSP1439-20131203/65409_1 /TAXON_ID=66791 /ORGANISM="Gonyaulax spinifera, Strain CCMP409" /LENGTH=217 /DNA_ID=CAMNT_0043529207 /DNA_START=1 /DNA_END=655 /DNA_ORIENTATION=+
MASALCAPSVAQPMGSCPHDWLAVARRHQEGAHAGDCQLVEDAETIRELQGPVALARSLSGREFQDHSYIEELPGGSHITLLADPACTTAVAYCLYQLPPEGFLWVEQIAVEEAYRGRGFGRMMMRWVVERAEKAGCWAVRLSALPKAIPFYHAIGFEDFHKGAAAQLVSSAMAIGGHRPEQKKGWPMHVILNEASRPQGKGGTDFFWPKGRVLRSK